MKVKELIKHLKKFNPEARVFLSSDEEGNNYSPLADNYWWLDGNFEKDNEDPLHKYDNWSLDENEKTGNYIILFPLY